MCGCEDSKIWHVGGLGEGRQWSLMVAYGRQWSLMCRGRFGGAQKKHPRVCGAGVFAGGCFSGVCFPFLAFGFGEKPAGERAGVRGGDEGVGAYHAIAVCTGEEFHGSVFP